MPAPTTEPASHGRENTVAGAGVVVAGRYRLERSLGAGGMGEVFEAEHLGLGRRVAIKVLRTARAGGSDVSRRFEREARALATLGGPHTVRVFDAGLTDDGRPFLVMERLSGHDLRARMDEGSVARTDAVRWVLEACLGLEEAHAQGIVHRDVKPENLFLARASDGTLAIKVIDFGIAKRDATSAEGTGALTGEAVVLGSTRYMSPEQIRAPRTVGPASDVWSLGVVLYELLVGRVPFEGDSSAAIVASIAADRPAPIRASVRGADVPRALEALVFACLEKEPGRRPADTRALAARLEPFAREVRPSRPLRMRDVLAAAAIGMGAFTPHEGAEVVFTGPQPPTMNRSAGLTTDGGPIGSIAAHEDSTTRSEPAPRTVLPANTIPERPVLSVVDEPIRAVPPAATPRALARAAGTREGAPTAIQTAAHAEATHAGSGNAVLVSPQEGESHADRTASVIERRK